MDNDSIKSKIKELVKLYVTNKKSDAKFIPGETMIPPSGKVIDDAEVFNIIDAGMDMWLTTGRFNEHFERKLANFLGVKKLISVNSGSSANLIAFNTLTSEKLGEKAIKKGDEVITVAAGFPTTINPSIQFGAIPVFVDIDIGTHNIDANKIECQITERTKAIMIAHSLGNPFDLEKVVDLCKKYNLWLIEDCCDALGSKFNDQMVGTFGDISTLSFYPAHHITMGEGGAVFSSNSQLMKIAESFRDWGRDCFCPPGKDNTCTKRFSWQLGDLPFGYDHKYTYSHMGYNLKITDMQAACGLAQLDKLDNFISSRKKNFKRVYDGLIGCEEFINLPVPTKNSDPSWFGFPITLKESAGIDRKTVIEFLNQNKIGTRLLFAGNVTKQPYMKNITFRASDLKNTDYIMNNTFWIGIYPGLTDEMLDFTIHKLKQILGVGFD